jgi:hypothetical protein
VARLISAVAAALVLASIAGVVPVSAQTSKPVPRAANGKPDLSGIWIAQGAMGLAAPEEEVKAMFAADAAAGRKPLPPREAPAYTPEAEARRQYYLQRRGIDDPMARCLLSGVPRIQLRPLPFRIVQLPSEVIILYEIHHAIRMIPTDGRPHPADMEPSYLGEGVGRWDGDTLVVDVRGFNDKSWLVGVGTIHTEKLRVTERYTRDSYDTILYEAVMEDPDVLMKPWRIQERFRLRPNDRIREYECIESNEDIQRFERLLQESRATETAR